MDFSPVRTIVGIVFQLVWKNEGPPIENHADIILASNGISLGGQTPETKNPLTAMEAFLKRSDVQELTVAPHGEDDIKELAYQTAQLIESVQTLLPQGERQNDVRVRIQRKTIAVPTSSGRGSEQKPGFLITISGGGRSAVAEEANVIVAFERVVEAFRLALKKEEENEFVQTR